MAKKKKKNRIKEKKGTQPKMSLPEWYKRGIEDWPLEQIFDQLGEYGLEMSKETYKQDAKDVSEPSTVAEGWVNKAGSDTEPLPELGEVFFHLSALALWSRLLPDRGCFELALDDLAPHIDRAEKISNFLNTEDEVTELLHILDRFVGFIKIKAENDEKEPRDILEDVSEDYGINALDFLINLPFDLEKKGFIEESARVVNKFIFLEEEMKKKIRLSNPITADPKIGRNEPCPCGSGLKYKKCCLDKA